MGRDIVVVPIIFPVLVHCAKHDASSAEDTPEQSGSDGVDGESVNETRIVDIANDGFATNAVKPTTHHFVDFAVSHAHIKVFLVTEFSVIMIAVFILSPNTHRWQVVRVLTQ